MFVLDHVHVHVCDSTQVACMHLWRGDVTDVDHGAPTGEVTYALHTHKGNTERETV